MTPYSKLIRFFIKSLNYAIQGILYTIKTQSNMRFHVVAGILVVILGIFFRITTIEWLFIITAISVVIIAECVNTAIECTIDLITKEHHILAKHSKDTAAGAVLIASIMAIAIGTIIFLPRLKGVFLGT
jgi:diacylglycerol kinase